MYHCSCENWSRKFAQRSMDHRGSPSFPGLVLNLISDGYASTSAARVQGEELIKPSCCIGVVYFIPDDKVSSIISELDFRERGGYQRQVIKVKLLQDTNTHRAGDIVDSLAYIGSTTNPNFVYDSSSKWYEKKIGVISAARGPSGPNFEYLFFLARFFYDNQYDDEYLLRLNRDVLSRLGVWKYNKYMSQLSLVDSNFQCEFIPYREATVRPTVNCWNISAWGSNEYHQHVPDDSHRLLIKDECYQSARTIGRITNEIMCSSGSRFDIYDVQVYCGGSHSAMLINHSLQLWGSNSRGQLGPRIIPSNVIGISLGHEHSLILLDSGLVLAFGDDSHGQCSGDSIGASAGEGPLKINMISKFLIYKNQSNFDEAVNWNSLYCNIKGVASKASIELQKVATCTTEKIIQVFAGVKHSAALTEVGSIYCWGGGRNAEYLLCQRVPWTPRLDQDVSSATIIDVALGCNHTVIIDSCNRVWTWGSNNSHLQLGRLTSSKADFAPQIITTLPPDVIWQRVRTAVFKKIICC